MSRVATALPNHLRPRREKCFGDGRPRPLDRNAKARIKVYARVLMKRTEPGKHYGILTAKMVAVLEALLWHFHNARSGLCFPSYETIAAKADCDRSTVYEAIKTLEDAGILTWVNRIVRIREATRDLFGRIVPRWRVIRTSNAYSFIDPQPQKTPPIKGFSSKSEIPTGTSIQESSDTTAVAETPKFNPDSPLDCALMRLGKAMGAIKD